jgi:hypothetical protein
MQIRKGYLATLTMVTFAMSASAVKAEAPVITDPGDYIVGDSEDGIGNNVFVFPDAFDLDGIVSDDTTADSAIKWSYSGGGRYLINGVPRLEDQGGVSVANINNPATEVRSTDGDNGGFNINPDLGGGTQDAAGNTVTIRNQILSPGTGATGPHGEPGTTGVLPGETETITLFASDCSTFSSVSITLYSSNETSDALSGLMENIFDLDFIGDPSLMSGWLDYKVGGASVGTLNSALGTGLCMTTPGPNAAGSEVGWRSPHWQASVNAAVGGPGGIPGLVELVDMSAVRFRATMWTDQATNGAVPFWTMGYYNVFFNNLNPTGDVFAGDYWWWSVAGAANRIALNGNPANNGRTQFDLWAIPNAAQTAAWRGLLPDLPGPTPNPDNDQSAFTTAFNRDWRNDINFQIRCQDGNSNLVHQNDFGTVCITRLRADRVDIRKLNLTARHGGPIDNLTHAIKPDKLGPGGTGNFVNINDAQDWAEFQVAANNQTNPNGARKTLVYWDDAQPTDPEKEYPFLSNWQDDEVLMNTAWIHAANGGYDGTNATENTDKINFIFMNWLAYTAEIGGFNYTTKSFGNNMGRAASPRQLPTVNSEPQIYTTIWSTSSASTAGAISEPDRIAPFLDFRNTTVQGTSTDGLDPFTVRTFEVWEVDQTGFLN